YVPQHQGSSGPLVVPGPGTPQHPDEGCVRYFVLATTAAIVALFLNVFYPLIYQTRWR
uniref:Uncharacterized protein n=1 Tax=Accipiter nisus TaxID=211598 RepID=A0A8B9MEM2_9AVES